MILIAKKPCRFGKQFFIGDVIPLECVLDPKAQEKMGVLVVVEGNSENDKADSEAGGSLLPPASTLEEEDTTIHEEETKIYSKNSLTKMNKDELLTIATEKGVEANENMTKNTIVDLIIKKQGE